MFIFSQSLSSSEESYYYYYGWCLRLKFNRLDDLPTYLRRWNRWALLHFTCLRHFDQFCHAQIDISGSCS